MCIRAGTFYHSWRVSKVESKEKMRLTPVIDFSECTDCGSCLEVCPEVFVKKSETGYIEVVYFQEYPEDCVQEAISVCPADCIAWEGS